MLNDFDKIDPWYWVIIFLATIIYAFNKALRETFIKSDKTVSLKEKWLNVIFYFAQPHVVIANAMTFLCGLVLTCVTVLSQNTPGAFLERSATIVALGTALGGAFILGYFQDKVSMRSNIKDSEVVEEQKNEDK